MSQSLAKVHENCLHSSREEKKFFCFLFPGTTVKLERFGKWNHRSHRMKIFSLSRIAQESMIRKKTCSTSFSHRAAFLPVGLNFKSVRAKKCETLELNDRVAVTDIWVKIQKKSYFWRRFDPLWKEMTQSL
jgi:hypothetical protein